MKADLSTREPDVPAYEENAVATLQFTVAPGQSCIAIHWHDRMELIRVQQGSLELCLNESQDITLAEGQLAIICPRQIHRGIAGSSGAVYDVVMFELSSFSNQIPAVQSVLQGLFDGRLLFDPVTDDPRVLDAFDVFLNTQKDAIYQSIGNVYALLGQMLLCCNPHEIVLAPAQSRFFHIADYVNDHYLEPLTTAQLCAHFGYNESYFCRRFKQHTGLPLLKYIEILRLEYSRKLLQNSNEPISQVALQSGFGDLCYFSQRFSAHFGIAPSVYRKNWQNCR